MYAVKTAQAKAESGRLRSGVVPRSEFGAYLAELLAARGQSARAFAIKVGKNPTYLSKVMRGEVPISADFVESWAEALSLHGLQRDEWRVRAWSTRTPQYMLDLLVETQRALAAAQRRSKGG